MKIWVRKDMTQLIERFKSTYMMAYPPAKYIGTVDEKYFSKLNDLYGQLLDVNEEILYEDMFRLKDNDMLVPQWAIDDVINDKRIGKQVFTTNSKTVLMRESRYLYSFSQTNELFTTDGTIVARSNAKNKFREWIRDLTPTRIYVYQRLNNSARLNVIFKDFKDTVLIGEKQYDNFSDVLTWLGNIKDKRVKNAPLIIESTSARYIEKLHMEQKANAHQ